MGIVAGAGVIVLLSVAVPRFVAMLGGVERPPLHNASWWRPVGR